MPRQNKSRLVPIICAQCGKAAKKPAVHVNQSRKRGHDLYCGRACYYASKVGSGLPVQDRIRRNIQVSPDGCWVWLGCKSDDGYGKVGLNGKTAAAHRVSYEAFVGPIPDGLTIDHLCRNRLCVNPAHLEPVTFQENCFRARKDVCINGHPRIGGNLYIDKRGQRKCRACHALASKRARNAKVSTTTGGLVP